MMGFIRAETRLHHPRDYVAFRHEKFFSLVEPCLPSPQLLQLHARSRQPGTRSFPTLHTPSIMYIYIYNRRRFNTFLLRECIGSPGGAVLMDLLFRAPPEA